MLTVDTIPLSRFWIFDCGLRIFFQSAIRNPNSAILFVFPMHGVAATATAELFELQPVGRVLLVLRRHVIALFALGALQNYVISRHCKTSLLHISHSKFQINLKSGIWNF